METKNVKEATACLDGIADLVHELPVFGSSGDLKQAIIPIRVLVDRAEALVDGSSDARDRKNAGDRKRRATTKAPGKKRRTKNPPARSSSSSGPAPPK